MGAKHFVLVMILMVAGAGVWAGDIELPEAVKKVFEERFKGATKIKVEIESAKGVKIYEVSFHDVKDLKREVEFTADGKIVCEECEVKTTDLPQAVAAAVKKAYPDATLESACEETANGKTAYEINIKTAKGKQELVVSADGSKIALEEDEENEKDEKDEKDEK